MSFSSPPATQTTVNDPWSKMPDWVRDYYQDQISKAQQSDDRVETLRQEYEGTDFIPEYAGGDAVAGIQASTDNAIGRAAEAFDASVDAVSGAADTAGTEIDLAREGAMSGMSGVGDDLAGIGTDLGSAFDTTDARGTMDGMDIAALRAGYENPYIEQVIDPTLSRMREEEALRMAQLEASGAATGGASNTRLAVEMARMNDEGVRSRAQVEGDLRSAGFRDAAQFGLQEADLRGRLAEMAAQLGLSESELEAQIRERSSRLGLDRAGAQQSLFSEMLSGTLDSERAKFDMAGAVAGAQSARGAAALDSGRLGLTSGAAVAAENELERRIRQERLMQPFTLEAFTRSQTATPLAVGLPNSGTQTSTQSGGGPAPASMIVGGATALTGLLPLLMGGSDERIKEDIEPLEGALDIIRGQRPSSYRYTDAKYDRLPIEGRRSAGLMAQDLEGIPGAVVYTEDGIRMVDTYPVMATIAAAVQELDRKVTEMSHG